MKVRSSGYTSEISAWLAEVRDTGLRPTRGPVVFSHDIFLSYSRFQVVDAKRIHNSLQSTTEGSQRTRIFFAENANLPDDRTGLLRRLGTDEHTDLRLEGRYLKWLTDILTSSCHFVAIVSQNYIDSPWCKYELSAFHQIAKDSPARGITLLVDEHVTLQNEHMTADVIAEGEQDLLERATTFLNTPLRSGASMPDELQYPFFLPSLWIELAERLVNDDADSGVVLDQFADYELAVREAMLKQMYEALSKDQVDIATELRAAAARPLFERWLERASQILQADDDKARSVTPSPWRESLNNLLERADDEAKELIDAGLSPW